MAPPALPRGFRLGVSTCGYQIEGGYNEAGGPANNWRDWENGGRVARSGTGLDFWNRFEEVLDRAVAAGCDTVRLSVEWARCEPEPDRPDGAAWAHYRAILDACHDRGIEPVIALHHFTHPAWLGPDFWLNLGSPERFEVWAVRAVEQLGDRCRHWVTLERINALGLGTYLTGRLPPGRRGRPGDAVRAIGHLLTAHVLAYRAIRERQPEAEAVSASTLASSAYELDRLLLDVLLARSHGVGRHDLAEWLVERRRALYTALPAPTRLERAVRRVAASILPLDQAVPRAVSEAYAGPHERLLDVIHLHYFDPVASHGLRLPGRRSAGGRSWSLLAEPWEDAVHPEGLLTYCRTNAEPGVELWVASGLCQRVTGDRAHPRSDGWDRVRHLRANLAAVSGAVASGAPVTRYFHHSLADGYEWGSYEPRFGLYAVDHRFGRLNGRDSFGADAAGAYRDLRQARPAVGVSEGG